MFEGWDDVEADGYDVEDYGLGIEGDAIASPF